jgi:hypothetical protein
VPHPAGHSGQTVAETVAEVMARYPAEAEIRDGPR